MSRILPLSLFACLVVLLSSAVSLAAEPSAKTVIEWRFDKDGDFRGWSPSGQIAGAAVRGGALRGRTAGTDPIIMGPMFSIEAKPTQCVEIRLKAAKVAQGQLFWTETLQGPYGGFSEKKMQLFQSHDDGQFHTIRVYPFWHAAKKIIRLRLDPPEVGDFEIQSIRVVDDGPQAVATKAAWKFDGKLTGWRLCEGLLGKGTLPVYFSPPVSVPADENSFVCIRMATTCPQAGRVVCVSRTQNGLDSTALRVRPDGKMHSYNVDMGVLPKWRDEILMIGVQLPGTVGADTRVESIEICGDPQGPAELDVAYFGPTEGINRAGRPVGVTCTLRNLGGQAAEGATATLEVPLGVKIVGSAQKPIERLSIYLPKTVSWQVLCPSVGRVEAAVKIQSPGREPLSAKAALELTPAPNVPKASYVPQPRPVASKYDVGVYYFPGFPDWPRWRPILDYPERKPVLGWYDEANPECADWQIKWAVEHGVKFFMLDWYWCKGDRHLEHWLHDAYMKAKYRSYLKWAIMWANHNPPNTHSLDDWRKVTQYWIDNYFHMKEYYRIDNRPVVFIWSPAGIRHDLGGSKEAARLYALSQEMVRAAGLPGIYFVAMSSHESLQRSQELKAEGYEAMTTYHGFGLARQRANSDLFPYSGILDTCREVWQQEDQRSAGLLYMPIVDTGWDSRPWHGEKSMVAYGRTPELFGKLCREARKYADETKKKIIAIGPWNEWGEGSYIEPYAEYGFQDLDQLRAAFCEPGDYPPNLIPSDVGRGPYDLKPEPLKTAWEFNADGDREGWTSGQIADFEVRSGVLRGKSTGNDPILQSSRLQVEAAQFRRLSFRMRITASDQAQVYWGTTTSKINARDCVTFDVIGDGNFHDYEIDFSKQRRWRGMINTLRIDPGSKPNVQFEIDHIRLH